MGTEWKGYGFWYRKVKPCMYAYGVTLVIFADGCYTLVTCSANDAVVLFQAGCSFSQLGKETNCVSTCFRVWAARHDVPPGLAHPAGYRVNRASIGLPLLLCHLSVLFLVILTPCELRLLFRSNERLNTFFLLDLKGVSVFFARSPGEELHSNRAEWDGSSCV